jgi:uncharacterized oligopeptide transporter (OPT) family protein
MFFRKKTKKATKKIDKLVTWLIIWWAVASIVWLSRTKKWQEITKDMKKNSRSLFSKIKIFLGKTTISVLDFFDKFKK